jgi:hypothetical protein
MTHAELEHYHCIRCLGRLYLSDAVDGPGPGEMYHRHCARPRMDDHVELASPYGHMTVPHGGESREGSYDSIPNGTRGQVVEHEASGTVLVEFIGYAGRYRCPQHWLKILIPVPAW